MGGCIDQKMVNFHSILGAISIALSQSAFFSSSFEKQVASVCMCSRRQSMINPWVEVKSFSNFYESITFPKRSQSLAFSLHFLQPFISGSLPISSV